MVKKFAGICLLLLLAVGEGFLYKAADDIFGHEVPLYTAAQSGDWKQLQTLLAHGADPNDTTDFQNDRTALFWAAYQGRKDIVELLIQKGIDVNKVDTHSQTALDWAGDKKEIVRVLRQAGAKTGSEL